MTRLMIASCPDLSCPSSKVPQELDCMFVSFSPASGDSPGNLAIPHDYQAGLHQSWLVYLFCHYALNMNENAKLVECSKIIYATALHHMQNTVLGVSSYINLVKNIENYECRQ